MEYIQVKDIIRSKIVDADKIYDQSCNLINEWYQEKVWELSEKAKSDVINFIDTIKDKIYEDGELVTRGKTEVIYSDDNFKLTYSFFTKWLDVVIITDREDIQKAYTFIDAIGPYEGSAKLTGADFTIFHRGEFIVNTRLGTPNFSHDYPASGVNSLTSYETNIY